MYVVNSTKLNNVIHSTWWK